MGDLEKTTATNKSQQSTTAPDYLAEHQLRFCHLQLVALADLPLTAA